MIRKNKLFHYSNIKKKSFIYGKMCFLPHKDVQWKKNTAFAVVTENLYIFLLMHKKSVSDTALGPSILPPPHMRSTI